MAGTGSRLRSLPATTPWSSSSQRSCGARWTRAGQYMARTAQTPNAIIEIVKGVILFLMLSEYLWSWLSARLRRKKAAA